MDEPWRELASMLRRIERLIIPRSELSSAVRQVTSTAESTIEGCDAASVTIVLEGEPSTLASSDRVVLLLHLVQYEHGQGPCVDAARFGDLIEVDFWPVDERYPYLANAGRSAEFTGVVSVPVKVHGEPVASLNLYTRRPGGFPESPRRAGRVLAAEIGVLLLRSPVLGSAEEFVHDLQRSDEQRSTLGQAEGLLMMTHHCTVEQARGLLHEASDTERRTLMDVAATVLDNLDDEGTQSRLP